MKRLRMKIVGLTSLLACSLLIVSRGIGQTPSAELALRRVIAMEYPPIARSASLQGKVELAATVSPGGDVKAVHIQSGPQPLSLPAKDVLLKWRFTGCPVRAGECEVAFIFSFVLDGTCKAGSRCPTGFEVSMSTSDGVSTGKVTITSKTIEGPIY